MKEKKIFLVPAILFLFLIIINYSSAAVTISGPEEEVISPGDPVTISFDYSTYCPKGYIIDIYSDMNYQNSVCTKKVYLNDWVEEYTYGGKICKRITVSTIITDSCGIESQATDGTYKTKIAMIDSSDNIIDYVTKSSLIQVISKKPDLLIPQDSVKTQPEEPMIGDNVKVDFNVSNAGLTDAENILLSAYLVSAEIKRKIFEGKIDILDPGQEKKISFDFNAVNLEPGKYSLLIWVDENNTIEELFENNNTATKGIDLKPNPSIYSKPNLETEIELEKENYNYEETVPLKVKIKNSGTIFSGEPFKLYLFDDESLIESRDITEKIDAGAEIEESFNLSALNYSGEVKFTAFADALNDLNESNENDNKAEAKVIVRGLYPDFIIEPVQQILLEKNQIIAPVIEPESPSENTFFLSASPKPGYFIAPIKVRAIPAKDSTYNEVFKEADLCAVITGQNYYSAKLYFGFNENLKTEIKETANYLDFLEKYGSFNSYSFIADNQYKELPLYYQSRLFFKGNLMSLYGKEDSGILFDPLALEMKDSEYEIEFKANCTGTIQEKNLANNSAKIKISFYPKKDDKRLSQGLEQKAEKKTSINLEEIKGTMNLNSMKKEISVGQEQIIELSHPFLGAQGNAQVEVITPSKKIEKFLTDSEGLIKIKPSEQGLYEIRTSNNGIIITSSFSTILLGEGEEIQMLKMLFGEKAEKEMPLIPVVILMALGVAFLSYIKTREMVERTTGKKERSSLIALCLALIFFFIPLYIYVMKDLSYFVALIVIEIIFLLLISFYVKEKKKKLRGQEGKETFKLKI
ncbi:MAG: CARDB domain-containing protein [Candidatus Diapherotrites archaeon]